MVLYGFFARGNIGDSGVGRPIQMTQLAVSNSRRVLERRILRPKGAVEFCLALNLEEFMSRQNGYVFCYA